MQKKYYFLVGIALIILAGAILGFFIISKSNCIPLGEKGNGMENDVCCGNLKTIGVCSDLPDSCACISHGGFICSECGNNSCESWENKCNCPQDCK